MSLASLVQNIPLLLEQQKIITDSAKKEKEIVLPLELSGSLSRLLVMHSIQNALVLKSESKPHYSIVLDRERLKEKDSLQLFLSDRDISKPAQVGYVFAIGMDSCLLKKNRMRLDYFETSPLMSGEDYSVGNNVIRIIRDLRKDILNYPSNAINLDKLESLFSAFLEAYKHSNNTYATVSRNKEKILHLASLCRHFGSDCSIIPVLSDTEKVRYFVMHINSSPWLLYKKAAEVTKWSVSKAGMPYFDTYEALRWKRAVDLPPDIKIRLDDILKHKSHEVSKRKASRRSRGFMKRKYKNEKCYF